MGFWFQGNQLISWSIDLKQNIPQGFINFIYDHYKISNLWNV